MAGRLSQAPTTASSGRLKPTVVTTTPQKSIEELLAQNTTISARKTSTLESIGQSIFNAVPSPIQDAITTVKEGLFGRGQEVDLAGRSTFDTGLVGFMRPFGIGKSNEQKVSERLDALAPLVQEGKITSERANEVAMSVIRKSPTQEGLSPTPELELSDIEKEAVRPIAFEETLDQIFGALDVVSFGTTKPLTRTAAQKIAKSKVAEDIYKILTKELPDLAENARQVFSRVLTNVDNVDDVERVINRTRIASQEAKKVAQETQGRGRLPAKTDGPITRANQEAAPIAREAAPIARVADNIPDELQPFAVEAKKYKGAEEFVNAQTTIYRGSESVSIRQKGMTPGYSGDSFTRSRDVAATYGESMLKKYIPESQILKASDVNPEVLKQMRAEMRKIIADDDANTLPTEELISRVMEIAKEKGKAAADLPSFFSGMAPEQEIRVLDHMQSTFTQSKLTDIWKKANQPADAAGKSTVGDVSKPALSSYRIDPPDKIQQLERMLEKQKLSLRAAEENPTAHQQAYGRDKRPEYQAAIDELEKRLDAARRAAASAPKLPTEDDQLQLMADEWTGSDYVLRTSELEEDRVVYNLDQVFAELKGISVQDLKLRFSDEQLAQAKMQYEFVAESLLDDPGRALVRFISKKEGQFMDLKDPAKAATPSERVAIEERNQRVLQTAQKAFEGTPFSDRYDDPDIIREAIEAYIEKRTRAQDLFIELQEISKNIRLSKQRDAFIGKEKARLARAAGGNIRALRDLVQAAERGGFRRGVQVGTAEYRSFVQTLKARRSKITAIKEALDLSDSEMREIRRQPFTDKSGIKRYKDPDPRFMKEDEFNKYLENVRSAAEAKAEQNRAHALVDAIIQERDLKKIENLQRAMQLPQLDKMSTKQLQEFGDALADTMPHDTFLGPRMIQTITNTDLGAVRTVNEAKRAIEAKTGMEIQGEVTVPQFLGFTGFLRDPALAARDPLHNLFITEWIGKEIERMTTGHALESEITKMANAARKARRKENARLAKTGIVELSFRDKVFAWLAPQDEYVTRWLQPYTVEYVNGKKVVNFDESIRASVEAVMTPEELTWARFEEKFFQHYYSIAADSSTARWTLSGVKHSNYKDAYFAHLPRGFFERWKDDGILKAIKMAWDENVADAPVDFNAFGDRGEVLGYEKWLSRSMTREGEGMDRETGKVFYTQNVARVTLAYFHSFEKKLALDSIIPKAKLYEFLLGQKRPTPKSVSNPAGTEQVDSKLRKHINEWLNTKKGQRVKIVYEQGSQIEALVDAVRLFITIKQLGANVIAQVISGLGGEAATFAGTGIRGWSVGHVRAITPQGRKIGAEYSGIIGYNPWNDLASATNEAGDLLRSGLFYIFGDLSYRARRQMLLGLLTSEEFKSGIVSAARQTEIKKQIGKWHALPEFRSVKGVTSEAKATMMYTEWAVPMIQTTYMETLPNALNKLRGASPSELPGIMASEEFQVLYRTIFASAGLGAIAYLVLNPDKNDNSSIGYIRRKAAQEIATVIQAVTGFGIPMPATIFTGYLLQLGGAMSALLFLERYESAGPGHKAGDLKGPAALYNAVVPSGVTRVQKLIFGEPETPIPTVRDVSSDILKQIQSGELSADAAKVKLGEELKKISDKQKERRFEMNPKDYAQDMIERIKDKEISTGEAKEELGQYLAQKQERSPEIFESDNDATFIDKVKTYAQAIGTDPITAFDRIFTGQVIRRTDAGAIIVERMSFEASQEERKERGATSALKLDHTIPLQLGGSNADSNLKLVPTDMWETYTPVENYLGEQLRAGSITGKKAQQLIRDFKDGKITDQDVYDSVERF